MGLYWLNFSLVFLIHLFLYAGVYCIPRGHFIARVLTVAIQNVRFAQRRFSFAQGILRFAQGNSQSSQRSLGDDWLVRISARVYCLFVCKTNYVF